MTTTFFLPKMSAATARIHFENWRCRIERMDENSCNITFFDKEEWGRFEEYCEKDDIEYEMV
jgi:hypothetical protein